MTSTSSTAPHAEIIRLRGTVQGAGVRPTVARIARSLGLCGWVKNDAEGVEVALVGPLADRDLFVDQLQKNFPPLAQLHSIERRPAPDLPQFSSFVIAPSRAGKAATNVAVDSAPCAACLSEMSDPNARRLDYPFINCTHCGPRFSIIEAIPYDRRNTTMGAFALCSDCRAEYENETDRRYHAEPIACPKCGPHLFWLDPNSENAPHDVYAGYPEHSLELSDATKINLAAEQIRNGKIVAVKGVGGVHLCCDATSETAVRELRRRKRRPWKPFALLVRDLPMVEHYCQVSEPERLALLTPAAPIVLLCQKEVSETDRSIAKGVAPGARTLGCFLPPSPLHHALMGRLNHPIVCTSGNITDEPQVVNARELSERLRGVADFYLDHNRPIAQRIDDSVGCLSAGDFRLFRRARGYAPAPLPIPPGFEKTPPLTAMGAQWKNTVCLWDPHRAILSQHMGDLDNLVTYQEWQKTRELLAQLYDHNPALIAVDSHPDYVATRVGMDLARERGLPIIEVQHHHAHIAACLAEHRLPINSPHVLGVALDGLGAGEGGEFWGCEFLWANYQNFQRLASLEPIALVGGDKSTREPWRSLLAHLIRAFDPHGLQQVISNPPFCDLFGSKPISAIIKAVQQNIFPNASSCGRLFDAVAAAVGIFAEHTDDEGQAAMALEQAILPEDAERASKEGGYPFQVVHGASVPFVLRPAPLFAALKSDLEAHVSISLLAARFHVGLSNALIQMVLELARVRRKENPFSTVALSGGVWQNRTLLELVVKELGRVGFTVLVPALLPANDGGISLGQAAVAAARFLQQ
ncbi:MAG: carbamoyltransferase HypF [Polyangiaceae bacterium]|nr:carbamoyltransferase HypF [Polyangiaceae bacterium]